MKEYRKKPVVIEACQFTDQQSGEAIQWWAGDDVVLRGTIMDVHTHEGWVIASLNDWIIRGVKGEFYPCKPDIFEMTYDPVQD